MVEQPGMFTLALGLQNIQGIYATSPTYQDNILSIMRQYQLI
jgi:flagellum-specific peptidoglycan hydrolase FlgJ